jgi:hypothetical protein
MKMMPSTMLALILCVSAVTFTGCTTTDPNTGERVFDAVRTERVQAVLKPAIASGVVIGVRKEAKALPIIEQLDQVLRSLVNENMIEPDVVNTALNNLDLTILDDPDAKMGIQIGVNTIIGLYNAAVVDRLRADVAEHVYLRAILVTLSEGISMGLNQARAQVSGG